MVNGWAAMWNGIWTGLVVAPIAWALNTQLGLILPSLSCSNGQGTYVLLSFALAAVTLVAAVGSWRAMPAADGSARARCFISGLSALMALLFAYALLLQGLSTVMLTACER